MEQKKKIHNHLKLNQFFATAICGNDVLSSSLYVSGIAVLFAGIYAPIVLLIIAVVLFFYKAVYTEVVEALPINGGAYNCLLNSTSKTIAAIAGVTTILSYIATAVISAKIAVEYVHSVFPAIQVIPVTIVLLLAFAILVISGIRDSARVAGVIFVFHIIALIAFIAIGTIHALNGSPFLFSNFRLTASSISSGGIIQALFFGFSASLLGVSGFESSANFVEEQEKGVFRKTLRNMLIGVAIFNPLIAFVILANSPIGVIVSAKEFVLSKEALLVGGKLFQYFIVLDAFLVLSGAVLTSYVGVGGLVYRMASDACLPGFLTKRNKKGSHTRIIIAFFLLSASILIITRGDLLSLAGVYTLAFLGVMSLFALGNLILRQTRTELKRTYTAPGIFVILALFATLTGIVGNIKIDPNNLTYFGIYFVPAVVLVLSVVYEDNVMRFLLNFTFYIKPLHKYITDHFEDLTSGTVIAFVNHVNRLHEILLYINKNETASNIILVHCRNWDNKDDHVRYQNIKRVLPVLKEAGVYDHLNIKLYYENKKFGPEAVREVSRKFRVRKNRIMIGSIHHFHEFDYSDLGGVRIII